MGTVVKADENGNIIIPQSLFGEGLPNAKYTVEQIGDMLTVVPLDEDNTEFDAEEWIKRFDDWMASLTDRGKIVPDTTFSREELYD
jgi:hypothetical protein